MPRSSRFWTIFGYPLPKGSRGRGLLGTLLFGAWLAGVASLSACQCDDTAGTGIDLQVRFLKPLQSTLSGRVEIEVEVTPSEPVHFIQVLLRSQTTRLGQVTRLTTIAELHQKPWAFRWNTLQVPDGFYILQAVATSELRQTYSSLPTLVQVANDPPDLFFVNCIDGQWLRGTYSLVVSINSLATTLKAPPTLAVNGVSAPPTVDLQPPYRYPIDTTVFSEGETITLAAEGEDLRGNQRRIVCRPRIDNTPPTLSFRYPSKEDLLVGREFTAIFDAFDRSGIREILLWVDNSPCPYDIPDLKKTCPTLGQPWISTTGPDYPITVRLSEAYKEARQVVLSARAVDQAGNLTNPPVQMRIRIDPLSPEIFIRSPAEGQVFEQDIQFTARVTDNVAIKEILFLVIKGKTSIPLLREQPNSQELTPTIRVTDVRQRFGPGRFEFSVVATDTSNNQRIRSRLFAVGCVDSTDCPSETVCHKTRCLKPAGLDQPCNDDLPCNIGATCTLGSSPVCTLDSQRYCRAHCNPGNQFVTADTCPPKFYCSRESVCLPAEGCTPLGSTCPPGTQCIPADDDAFYCIPIGSIPLGQACQQSCSASGNCQDGSWCVFLIENGRTACLEVCDTRKPLCRSPQRCIALIWSFGGQPLRYGICQ